MKIAFSKKRLFIFAAAAFFLSAACLLCARTLFSSVNAAFYCGGFTESYGQMTALNVPARFQSISEGKYVFFAFTEKQRAALEKIYSESPAALTVRLGIQNAERKRYENAAAAVLRFYLPRRF